MNIFDAAILGVVEGVTEFLPISSTGHLILTAQLLNLPTTEFLKSFEIIIQLGAICAVIALYWRLFLNIEILKKVIVGFIPTGIIGLALYKIVKTYLIGNEYIVLTSLLLGGIALIVFEKLHTEDTTTSDDVSTVTYTQAIWIGFFQSIAIIPGISRSAASIVGGMLLGLRRKAVVEFSFLLAVPTMGAATTLDLLKNYKTFSATDVSSLAIGFVTAFVVALFVIQYFLKFIKTRTFIPFGIYRIVIAIIFFLMVV